MRLNLIRWVRNIAFKMVVSMEKRQIRSIIAIQTTTTKKESSGKRQKMDPESYRIYKEAWNRGRVYGEKIWWARMSRRIKEIQSRKNIQENGEKPKEVIEVL